MNSVVRVIGRCCNGINHVTRRQLCSKSGDGIRVDKTFLNEITLIGRVGRTPEVRGENQSVVIFPLATHSFWKDAEGEQKQKVDWHRIMISRTSMQSYATQYVETGDRVLVKGKLQYRTVVNPETGKVSDSVAYISTHLLMILRKRLNPNRAEDNEDYLVGEVEVVEGEPDVGIPDDTEKATY